MSLAARIKPSVILIGALCCLVWIGGQRAAADQVSADTPEQQAKEATWRAQQAAEVFMGAEQGFAPGLAGFVEANYPTLCEELVAHLYAEDPQLIHELLPTLVPVIQEDYPGIHEAINQTIAENPESLARVSQILNEGYPNLLATLAAVPAGPERERRTAELLAGPYAGLLEELLVLFQAEFPEVFADMRARILEEYPEILAEVVRVAATQYPELTEKALAWVMERYPSFLPQLVELVYGAGVWGAEAGVGTVVDKAAGSAGVSAAECAAASEDETADQAEADTAQTPEGQEE
jgi:hypothetical protein